MFDITIIGAGPGGYHTAIRAAQKGLNVALIEKNRVGGVCLNVGCIPTKALFSIAKKLIDYKKFPNIGLSSKDLIIDFNTIQKFKNDTVSKIVGSVEELLKKHKITLFKGEGYFNNKNLMVKTEDKEIQIDTKNIVIATGSSPLELPFFNIDHKTILDSTDLLNIEKIPKSLIVLGAGVMGIEFATIFNAMGTDVTVIELENQILPSIDKIVASQQMKMMKKRGIKFELKQKVSKISSKAGNAVFELENGKVFIAEKGLISIGRSFNSNISGIDQIGIKKGDHGEIIVDQNHKTSCENIYAIGDVTGGMLLAHVASYEGDRVLNYIINGETKPYKVIPSAIFSIPEIATVGKTSKDDRKLKKGVFSYGASGKAIAIGEDEGLAIIYSEDDKIVGATILGAEASNLIQIVTIAIQNKIDIESFRSTVFPHPTLSEIILEASEDIDGEAIHKYSPPKKNR